LNGWVAHKYSLESLLASDHPYKVYAPYTYNTVWSYSLYSDAKAASVVMGGSDAWIEGDVIRITGGASWVDFIYHASLAANGHIGLRHRVPFSDAVEYSTATVYKAEGPAVDPDTWTGWSVLTTDYSSETVTGGKMRLTTQSTATVQDKKITTTFDSSFAQTFVIAPGWNVSKTDPNDSGIWIAQYSYDGTNARQFYLGAPGGGGGTDFKYVDSTGTYISLGVPIGTVVELYVYLKAGVATIWNGSTRLAAVVPQTIGGANTFTPYLYGYNTNASQTTYQEFESLIVGKLS